MSRLLCCLREMGAALSHPQEGEACDDGPPAPPTMADVIRERKKKAGGAALGTLRRRLANAARRPRPDRPDRGCEHARFIRGVVSMWRLAEVFLLCEELEAGAALRDLCTQAELAREPAAALQSHLAAAHRDRWWCDVELVGAGWSLAAHKAILSARSTYFRELLRRYPSGCCRIPLDGVCANLSRDEVEACVGALYTRCPHAHNTTKRDRDRVQDCDTNLDIISAENTQSCGCSCGATCSCRLGGVVEGLLGCSRDERALQRDMQHLLDSGDYADARLSFRVEGAGGAYGFPTQLDLPCHRVILAARSRFLWNVLSKRSSASSGGGGSVTVNSSGVICVDERVLPRRFARALLHAAYTDQVDLSLVGRSSSSPSATNSGGGGNMVWPGVARSASGPSRNNAVTMLDDAFQLYEIARFMEMPIVVQGCEDAIVEALSPETLPHVLKWAAAEHASKWVQRQAMRYFRDEFPTIMAHSASARLPRPALADVLASSFLQASEAQALRALIRWAERSQPQDLPREPNVVWHTAHSVSRRGARGVRGARRREESDATLREAIVSLVGHVRVEHLPHNSEILQQAVRRGLLPAPPPRPGPQSADAWLGRGACRPARCLLPYLDELKALLEDQAVPEAEVARVRRSRYLHRIPDTLYMVAAARKQAETGTGTETDTEAGGGSTAAVPAACVSPRMLGVLRARVAELRAAPNVLRARRADSQQVQRQLALRAVREMSLPDSCAELLLMEPDLRGGVDDPGVGPDVDADVDAAGAGAGWESPEPWRGGDVPNNSRTGTLSSSCGRCPSAGSLQASLHSNDDSRSNSYRRQHASRSSRSADSSQHRACGSWGAGAGSRLCSVPDVAQAPNANTHLLTHHDYFRHWEMSGVGGGGLQLDLGDGATHTPRAGSRAHRNTTQFQNGASQVQRPPRNDDEDLRAALELSVIRAYSSLHPAAPSPLRQSSLQPALHATTPGGGSIRADSPSRAAAAAPERSHHTLSRGSSAASGARQAARRTPSPRRARQEYSLYYRLDGNFGASAASSRGHSPGPYS